MRIREPTFNQQNIVRCNKAGSIIIFSHGSGSSKNSTRNRRIVTIFNKAGLSTLLIDLLTDEENEMDVKALEVRDKIPGLLLNKFNIDLLTRRLISITKWLVENKSLRLGRIGYFGSSTGAAATFIAASKLLRMLDQNELSDIKIGAIVSRGGRTDLVKDTNILKQISIPSLFIVGSKDFPIIKLNRKMMIEFNHRIATKMQIIEGASHLFEEEGKIDEVAEAACRWFLKYL